VAERTSSAARTGGPRPPLLKAPTVARCFQAPAVAESTPIRSTEDRMGPLRSSVGPFPCRLLLLQQAGAKYKPLNRG
jgi:hypothetical protein